MTETMAEDFGNLDFDKDFCDPCYNGQHHHCTGRPPCTCDHTRRDVRECEERQEMSDYLNYG
jgi:hypothetical protein